MKLKDVKNWRALHFGDRTILPSDKDLFHPQTWNELLDLEVEAGKYKGHYNIKIKGENTNA